MSLLESRKKISSNETDILLFDCYAQSIFRYPRRYKIREHGLHLQGAFSPAGEIRQAYIIQSWLHEMVPTT